MAEKRFVLVDMETLRDAVAVAGKDEIEDAFNAADTLATRLAAVERERDALRELCRRAMSCVEYESKHSPFEHIRRHRTALAADITTALLGKENTDGQ